MQKENPLARRSQSLRDIMSDRYDSLTNEIVESFSTAGYLEFTTARKSDIIKTINYIFDYIDSSGDPSADPLINMTFKESSAADPFAELARDHSARGISLDMFLGAFKLVCHCVLREIISADISFRDELAYYFIERTGAAEHFILKSWQSAKPENTEDALMVTNRKLSVAKCRYENILEAGESLIIIFNEKGIVSDSNLKMKKFIGEDPAGQSIINVLPLQEQDVRLIFRKYMGIKHEIHAGDRYFSLKLIPLGSVSASQMEYMFILNDITASVNRRKTLEDEVAARTAELEGSQKFFESIVSSAGDGILIFDSASSLIRTNYKACRMFGVEPGQSGGKCLEELNRIFQEGNQRVILRVAEKLKSADTWDGEIEMLGSFGRFPALVTVNRFAVDDKEYFSLLVRDITNIKNMENQLIGGKKDLEEKNITLRNIIDTIRNKEEDLMEEISFRMETRIMPLLERLYREKDDSGREMYYTEICSSLSTLLEKDYAKNTANEMFAKLSKTEERISRLIVSGYSTKEIADDLCVSIETVQTHRKNIRKKLDISNRNINLYSYLKNMSNTQE
jgi:PAS domain S-box-containing protein